MCCFATYVICQLAEYLVLQSRQGLAFNHLVRATSGAMSDIDRDLIALTDTSSNLLESIQGQSFKKEDKTKVINQLGLAMKQVQQGSFATAAATVKAIPQAFNDTATTEIDASLQLGQHQAQLIHDYEAENQRIKAQMDSEQIQFDQLRSQLASFFSLQAKESSELKTYTNGLLSGLPIIDNLPDNIADAAQLKIELAKLNGGVDLTGPEAPTLFSSKLEQIRSGVQEIFKDRENKQSEIIENDAKLSNARKQFSETKRDIYSKLAAVLVGQAAPNGPISAILTKNEPRIPSPTS